MKKIRSWKQKNSNDMPPTNPKQTPNLENSLLSETTETQVLADFNLPSQETSPIIPTSEQEESESPVINELGQNITAIYECCQKLTALQTSHQQLSEKVEQLLTNCPSLNDQLRDFGTQLKAIAEKVEGINTKFATLTDLETSQFQQLKSQIERLPNDPELSATSVRLERKLEETQKTILENVPANYQGWINNLFALIMMIAVPVAAFLGVVVKKREQDQAQMRKNLDDWLAKAERGINLRHTPRKYLDEEKNN